MFMIEQIADPILRLANALIKDVQQRTILR